MIELFGGYPRSHLDLLGVGEVLTGQSLPTEHSPPRLLQVEPGRAFGDEHLLYPRMSRQPLLNRGTLVAGEVVGDEVDLSGGIGLLDRLEQSELALGVSGGSGERQRLAVFDPQSTVDPNLLGTTTVLQRRLDAMAVQRPARGGRICARAHRPEFVEAGHRGTFRWVGVEADDSGSFGTNSGSSLSAHGRVLRQRTPSRRRIRLI